MGEELDPQCRSLVDAMNRIPGLWTTESCCGHDKNFFRVFFDVIWSAQGRVALTAVTFSARPDIAGYQGLGAWTVEAYANSNPVSFVLESTDKGKAAYGQSLKIANAILRNLAPAPRSQGGVDG